MEVGSMGWRKFESLSRFSTYRGSMTAPPKQLFRFTSLLIPLLLITGLLALSGSKLIAMKVVAFLILPPGFLWITGLLLVCWPGVKGKARALLTSAWVLFTLAGSPYVGNALLRNLEKPFYPFETPGEKFDVIILLGGGTAQSPAGKPALGTHGDRILKPAMLYQEGLAGKLITTGRSITERGADRLLSHETAEIWTTLGIPSESIIEVPEPRNTEEELTAVAGIAKQNPEWRRIGLSSSASHLRRAMKQADRAGLEVIPVPSDFRSQPISFSPMYVIPQGRGFRDVQTALWEYLGMLL